MTEPAVAQLRPGGHQTHLNRVGEGNTEPILFLHGSGPGATSWSNWQYALPALGGQYDCLAPDLIGYGKSEHLEAPPNGMADWLDLWTGQLVGLLDELELPTTHLVGNSMGGALALHLIDRYPERVNKVVLMGTMGVPFRITDQLSALWGFYDDPSPARMAQVIRWFVYDPAIVGGDLDAIAETRFEAAMDPRVSKSFSAMFPSPRQQHVDDLVVPDEKLARMEHPTLLVHGRDDGIIPLDTSLYLLEHLPRVQLHVFGRCRHWIQIEHRHAFNQLLDDFFGARL